MFDWLYLQLEHQYSNNGQDASAWGTEGLAITRHRFLLKAKAFYFRYSGACGPMKCSFDFRKSQSIWCHWLVLGNGECQLDNSYFGPARCSLPL